MRKSMIMLALVSVIAMAVIISVSSAGPSTEPKLQVAPENPRLKEPIDRSFGYEPPPMDISYIEPYGPRVRHALSSWDWRAHGGVTPVDNQNPYGTCWAFASTANLESQILLNESATYDLSKSQIVNCNLYKTDCNTGGNIFETLSLLTTTGIHKEADDPYDCPDSTCHTTLTDYQMIRGWKLIANDVETIKSAVYDYGPVFTSMYASFPAFNSYNGTCIMKYAGTEATNHAVTIVGWDDAMNLPTCGGGSGPTGVWIVKNSWGTGWGASGYFYIAYGNARMGEGSSVITEYKYSDPLEKLMYYDGLGYYGYAGYGNTTAYQAIRHVPAENGHVTNIDFWTTDAVTSYEIKIYDTFNGATLGGLLRTQTGGPLANSGYYSISLQSPLPVTASNDIIIVLKSVNNSFTSPIVFVPKNPVYSGRQLTEPVETDKCYISSNGISWTKLGEGTSNLWDLGVRARMWTPPTGSYTPPDPNKTFYLDANGDQSLMIDDLSIHKSQIFTGNASYTTSQPNNANQKWNTCDANGDLNCMIDDYSSIKGAVYGSPLATKFSLWMISNIDLDTISNNTSKTWIPFKLSVKADKTGTGSYIGRPGINIKLKITAYGSTTTGRVSGRRCVPNAGGGMNQFNLDYTGDANYDQCAVAVSVTDWIKDTANAPTSGQGLYDFGIYANAAGNLRVVAEFSAQPMLKIPAASVAYTVHFQ